MVVGGIAAEEQGWAGKLTYSIGWQWAAGLLYLFNQAKWHR